LLNYEEIYHLFCSIILVYLIGFAELTMNICTDSKISFTLGFKNEIKED